MNFYLVTYAISFVKVNDENIKEDVAHVVSLIAKTLLTHIHF
jgi:hypothetical protein